MVCRRHLDADHPGYDPNACSADGRAQCRRCLGDLPHPHAMFCGAECEHEFRIRSSPAYARLAVYRRDRGVCLHCRLDCGRRTVELGDCCERGSTYEKTER